MGRGSFAHSLWIHHKGWIVREGLRKKERAKTKMSANLKVVGQEEAKTDFADFWAIYPRKQARKDALKAWSSIDPLEYPKILRGVMQAKRCDQWTRDGGQYIPMPATYLRGERWNDEMEIEVVAITPAGQVKDSRCQKYVGEARCDKPVVFWNVHGTKGGCREHGPL